MTIKTIRHENPIGIEFIFSDSIYGQDIIDINKEILTDEYVRELQFKIVDLTGVDKNYTSISELKEVVSLDRKHAKTNPKFKTAIISNSYLFTQVADLYSILLGLPKDSLRIYPNRLDAESWLKVG